MGHSLSDYSRRLWASRSIAAANSMAKSPCPPAERRLEQADETWVPFALKLVPTRHPRAAWRTRNPMPLPQRTRQKSGRPKATPPPHRPLLFFCRPFVLPRRRAKRLQLWRITVPQLQLSKAQTEVASCTELAATTNCEKIAKRAATYSKASCTLRSSPTSILWNCAKQTGPPTLHLFSTTGCKPRRASPSPSALEWDASDGWLHALPSLHPGEFT